MASDKSSVTGLVLAGGTSSRYGDGNKLVARYDGSTLIDHVVTTLLNTTGEPPVVAVRTDKQRREIEDGLTEPDRVRFRRDSPEYDGPIAGIAGGITAVATPWVFVCGGDMPHLSGKAIEQLAARGNEETDVVVPVRDGYREPLHALYDHSAVKPALTQLPTNAGPRALFTILSCTDVPLGPNTESLSRSLQNVNTQEELDRLSDAQS